MTTLGFLARNPGSSAARNPGSSAAPPRGDVSLLLPVRSTVFTSARVAQSSRIVISATVEATTTGRPNARASGQ
jgi:hypothetical protein